MKLKKSFTNQVLFGAVAIVSLLFFSACNKDDDSNRPLQSMSFDYQFHNGQAVPSVPYLGIHPSNFSATLRLEELENGGTRITVSIQNSMEGETYHVHTHDAAAPSSTPNDTPYNETPNADIFAQALMGNGGIATINQETTTSFEELTANYEGFFVIHDPLQAISTVDIGTYLVVGGFARNQTTVAYASSTFEYDFNTGQLVPDFAYEGTHNDNLSATITVAELAENKSRVTVHIKNSMNNETYHTHVHDVADPTSTPNGTPYMETPNVDVFVAPIEGNGTIAAKAVISPKSHEEITSTYEGFFVIHDPLQTISTTDPTTYVILGSFAR